MALSVLSSGTSVAIAQHDARGLAILRTNPDLAHARRRKFTSLHFQINLKE
jgi:hypothetical protein